MPASYYPSHSRHVMHARSEFSYIARKLHAMKKVCLAVAVLITVILGLEAQNILRPEEKEEGWVLLFDGKTTDGWRTYGAKNIGSSWVVKDGVLALEVVPAKNGKTKSADGGDIITLKQYENYDFSIDWMVGPCANSGIIFNVVEDKKYKRTYHTGPEMQVLDNSCHPDAKIHTHRAGDLYDMIACSEEVVNPAGEWNTARIRVENGVTEFYLNEKNVVSFTMFDDNWQKMIAESKFKDMPGFGKYRKGHIALQDHGDAVAYKNIKIKEL